MTAPGHPSPWTGLSELDPERLLYEGTKPGPGGSGPSPPARGDFLARAALADVRSKGPKLSLTWFTAPGEVIMFGGEIVLAEDRVLGRVTSAGYGYTVGRNVLCAYVAADEPVHAHYAVEVMGQRYPAVRHSRPLYDPDRKAILAAPGG